MATSTGIPTSNPPPDFFTAYPRCVLMLESCIQETLSLEWEDYSRKRALDMAQALLDGCKVCGYREGTGILRSVIALLLLQPAEALGVLPALGDKLEDLLSLLRQHVHSESA